MEPMRIVPLTSYSGFEIGGSFSPDGNQVAFSWTGGDTESFDIYVKLIGPGPPSDLPPIPAGIVARPGRRMASTLPFSADFPTPKRKWAFI